MSGYVYFFKEKSNSSYKASVPT